MIVIARQLRYLFSKVDEVSNTRETVAEIADIDDNPYEKYRPSFFERNRFPLEVNGRWNYSYKSFILQFSFFLDDLTKWKDN